MTRRAREEDGFMLVAAILLLGIMMTIALAVVAFSDTQQNQSRVERVREASFRLTEASMQHQIFQLGRKWPGSAGVAYPAVCSPASPALDPCPDNATLSAGYAGTDYPAAMTCPAGTPAVPWTTEVRDNGNLTKTSTDVAYYNRALALTRPTYDANLDGKLWVRATAVASCKVQTVVALVKQNLTPLQFPRNVVTANWFQTNNKGAKTIVDTRGPYAAEPADLSLRCDAPSHTPCADYVANKGQVSPNRLVIDPATSPTFDADQLQSFRLQAQSTGRYYGSGACPDLTGVAGGLVFIESTSSNCTMPGGFSDATPGVLVIANGTIGFGGNSVFYGIIYAANLSNIAGPVVTIGGTAAIQGAVAVDGPGGVIAGASKANIVFDDRAFPLIKGYAGAGFVQNSWRTLPAGQ
ncbi:MAG TPA: hypothetical protein VF533_10170 [Solirubrobacteraceae bacterium]|jgi:type II secretory pathway pseudopilin PulG